ncbi:MAG TPA: hypothetical protein VFG84_01685, partial [Gemmatimonadaceae bacterium]|nr:hypothetical protein [Gemmatimonadaceae bacterium]
MANRLEIETVEERWELIGQSPIGHLVEARLELHHALQLVVSAAISYLPRVADDSHTNLGWHEESRALLSHELPAPGGAVRVGIRPVDLTLVVRDERNGSVQEVPLAGRTLADAEHDLVQRLEALGLDGTRWVSDKHYTIPYHDVAAGARFAAVVGGAHAELGRLFHNAHELASAVAHETPGAATPRLWPHHFDLATLIVLPARDVRITRSIGVGVEPGDDSYAEPYVYVGPSPHPSARVLRPLGAGGHWHTDGWMGAVLTREEMHALDGDDARAQGMRALRFVREAIEASRLALA